jgi:plastocyanin
MPAMSTRTVLTASVLALAGMALAACGSDGGGSGATLPADVGLVVDAGPGLKFGAESYTSAAGDVVIALENKDTQRHTMLIVDGDNRTLPGHLEVSTSGQIDSNDYALVPGEYKLICDVPGHEDMKATLTVK